MWVTYLSLLFQSTLVQALEVENGLVLYWNFEQVKGKTVKDEIGKFDGEIKDSDLKAVPSKNGLGNALKFDGKGYVHIDQKDVIDFGNKDGFSVALWLKSPENNKTIFSYGSGSKWEKHEKEMYVAKAGEPGSEGPNTGPVEIVGWGCELTTTSGITWLLLGMPGPKKALSIPMARKALSKSVTTAVQTTKATPSDSDSPKACFTRNRFWA